MLSFNNLELVLGGNTLFNDVSLTIHHHQKVGLVGANGTGKTSLFKVIKNEYKGIYVIYRNSNIFAKKYYQNNEYKTYKKNFFYTLALKKF